MIGYDSELNDFRWQSIRSSRFIAINAGGGNLLMLDNGEVLSVCRAVIGFAANLSGVCVGRRSGSLLFTG